MTLREEPNDKDTLSLNKCDEPTGDSLYLSMLEQHLRVITVMHVWPTLREM